MSSPRAQRTLVKSPPELWAEVSDVTALARHLGELGDIRITRLEAETTVAWEGDRVCGTVELEPSGWGTKVTLTAATEPVAHEPEVEEAALLPAPPGPPKPRRRFLDRLRRRRAAATVEAPESLEAPRTSLDDGAVEAILVGLLDDLGAAHHRPFSRG